MSWIVTKVFDGDSFLVSPNWEWKGRSNNGVRLAAFDAPEKDKDLRSWRTAKDRLTKLIENKRVDLKNVRTIDVYGRLVCDVHVGGLNVVALLSKPSLA